MLTPERTYDEQIDRDPGFTILIVDDEEAIRSYLSGICKQIEDPASLNILTANSTSAALEIIHTTPVHVCLLDKYMKNENGAEDNGIEAIPEMLRIRPQLQILMVSASKDIQDVVEAMKLGAFGYVTKDYPRDELLVAQIRKAVEMARLIVERDRLERSVPIETTYPIIAKSKASQHLLTFIPLLAESDRPVLLLGPMGAGKSVLAKVIHDYRKKYLKQSDRPFFNVNLPALSPSIIERELFGNEAGAFTSALKKTHLGFFELANNGTLFLDEIADISPDIQVKLLRILREGIFQRVGGTKELLTSFKLICATNKDLKSLVAKGLFREDLYRRISCFSIELPPLRERKEDIPELIQVLLPKMCQQSHVYVAYDELPQDFIEYITNHPLEANFQTLEDKLSYLLTFSPKDRAGRPLLKRWRKIPQIMDIMPSFKPKRDSLNLGELLELPFNVLVPDFPGLTPFSEAIEEKILIEARSKLRKNKDIARVLGLSEAATCVRLKHLSQKQKETLSLVAANENDARVLQ